MRSFFMWVSVICSMWSPFTASKAQCDGLEHGEWDEGRYSRTREWLFTLAEGTDSKPGDPSSALRQFFLLDPPVQREVYHFLSRKEGGAARGEERVTDQFWSKMHASDSKTIGGFDLDTWKAPSGETLEGFKQAILGYGDRFLKEDAPVGGADETASQEPAVLPTSFFGDSWPIFAGGAIFYGGTAFLLYYQNLINAFLE